MRTSSIKLRRVTISCHRLVTSNIDRFLEHLTDLAKKMLVVFDFDIMFNYALNYNCGTLFFIN